MSTTDRTDLADAWARSSLSVEQLWLAYVALGGTGSCQHVLELVQGVVPATPAEHLVLAHAFHEHFAHPEDATRVAYPRSAGRWVQRDDGRRRAADPPAGCSTGGT